jgi:hypothetical protein
MTIPISEIRSEIFKPKSRKKSHRIKKNPSVIQLSKNHY